MRTFGVCVYESNQLGEFGYATRDRLREATRQTNRPLTGLAFFHSLLGGRDYTNDGMDKANTVFWTDTREDAELLAQVLSEHHSGRSYVVFESKVAYTSKPSVPTKSVFTEKGIVPA